MLHVSLILWLTGLDEMLCELLRSPSLSVRFTRGVGGAVISPAHSFHPCQETKGPDHSTLAVSPGWAGRENPGRR